MATKAERERRLFEAEHGFELNYGGKLTVFPTLPEACASFPGAKWYASNKETPHVYWVANQASTTGAGAVIRPLGKLKSPYDHLGPTRGW